MIPIDISIDVLSNLLVLLPIKALCSLSNVKLIELAPIHHHIWCLTHSAIVLRAAVIHAHTNTTVIVKVLWNMLASTHRRPTDSGTEECASLPQSPR